MGETNVPADKAVKLKNNLKVLDDILEGNLYLTGEEPSIADISILSTFVMFKSSFTDMGDIQNVDAWFKHCENLPGFEENVASVQEFDDFMNANKLSPISLQ